MLLRHIFISFLTNVSTSKAMKTIFVCEDEDLRISCFNGFVISIIRANFGRFSIAVCNKEAKEDLETNCESMDESTSVIINRQISFSS